MKKFGSFFSTLKEWMKTNQHTITSGLTSWDNSHKSIYMRLTIVAAAFGFFFTTVSYRVLSVALSHHSEKKGHFAKNVSRKEIVDRNGALLAVNIPASSVFANPEHMINIEGDVAKLAKTIPGIDKKKLISELTKDGKTFVWVKRDLTPKEQQTIHDLGIAGLYFENEERRLYTYGTISSHILGHVGRDGKGLAGIEKYFDDLLNHQVSSDNNDEHLALTIDIRVQNIVSEELDKVIKEFNATGGVGIVADPNTGEILALVSKPDFDPHNPSKASDNQLFNRASLGIYELGSIMKCITLAVGFDSKTITMHDAYNLSNFRVGKFQVKDYHKEEGWHSVADVFLNSSNIGSTQIALEIGQEKFRSYYKKLGLLDQVKLDIPERGYPLFPKNSDWSDITLTTMSYGYGVSVSPLHFVQAMIPVVNGGYMHGLKLVKKQNNATTSEKILDESTSEAMRKLLRLVVAKGTGKKAEVPGYLVGGKTGTANKREGKSYVSNNRMSSFFGTMPSINPKYVVLVMLDEPKPSKNSFGFATAGWNAAPATGAILSRIAALYGMSPYDMTNTDVQEQLEVDYQIDSET